MQTDRPGGPPLRGCLCNQSEGLVDHRTIFAALDAACHGDVIFDAELLHRLAARQQTCGAVEAREGALGLRLPRTIGSRAIIWSWLMALPSALTSRT